MGPWVFAESAINACFLPITRHESMDMHLHIKEENLLPGKALAETRTCPWRCSAESIFPHRTEQRLVSSCLLVITKVKRLNERLFRLHRQNSPLLSLVGCLQNSPSVQTPQPPFGRLGRIVIIWMSVKMDVYKESSINNMEKVILELILNDVLHWINYPSLFQADAFLNLWLSIQLMQTHQVNIGWQ